MCATSSICQLWCTVRAAHGASDDARLASDAEQSRSTDSREGAVRFWRG